MDVRRDYPPGFLSFLSLKHVRCLALPNSAAPREKSLERTVCPIVVSVLCNGDTAGGTFQRAKAVVESEALLKLSCVHHYCHWALFDATRGCQKRERGKKQKGGMEGMTDLPCLPFSPPGGDSQMNSRFLFNACSFLLRAAFGTTISRTRALECVAHVAGRAARRGCA